MPGPRVPEGLAVLLGARSSLVKPRNELSAPVLPRNSLHLRDGAHKLLGRPFPQLRVGVFSDLPLLHGPDPSALRTRAELRQKRRKALLACRHGTGIILVLLALLSPVRRQRVVSRVLRKPVPKNVACVVQDDASRLAAGFVGPHHAAANLQVQGQAHRRPRDQSAAKSGKVVALGQDLAIAHNPHLPRSEVIEDSLALARGHTTVDVRGWDAGFPESARNHLRVLDVDSEREGCGVRARRNPLAVVGHQVTDDGGLAHAFAKLTLREVAGAAPNPPKVRDAHCKDPRREQVALVNELLRCGDDDDVFEQIAEGLAVEAPRSRGEPNDDRLGVHLEHFEVRVALRPMALVDENHVRRASAVADRVKARADRLNAADLNPELGAHPLVTGCVDSVRDPMRVEARRALLNELASVREKIDSAPLSHRGLDHDRRDRRLAGTGGRDEDLPALPAAEALTQAVDPKLLVRTGGVGHQAMGTSLWHCAQWSFMADR